MLCLFRFMAGGLANSHDLLLPDGESMAVDGKIHKTCPGYGVHKCKGNPMNPTIINFFLHGLKPKLKPATPC